VNIFLAISLFSGGVPMGFYRNSWVGYKSEGTPDEIQRYNLNGIVSTMGASAVSFVVHCNCKMNHRSFIGHNYREHGNHF